MKTELTYCDDYKPTNRIEEIEASSEIELFEKFYKMNNRLRYCNGSYYIWSDSEWNKRYKEWLMSDDFKGKHFRLFYGGGVVD